jgi:diadenosine tetraphosphate (Ap4A) HIT family hydrolase
MSKWNASEWPGLVSGAACPICRAGKPKDIVCELSAAYLTASAEAPMRGYCCLVLKRHAVELFELAPGEAAALMHDAQRVARLVQAFTGAVKLNYEIHGNTIPHLHLHIFPRFRGDPFEGRPIDPKRITASPYEAGAFEAFVQALKGGLS